MTISKDLLKISNLSVFVGKKKILDDLNYVFEQNKTYVIIGPNGSGKSTLAHTIAGNPVYKLSPESKIIFNDIEIKDMPVWKRAKMGLFLSFQSPLELSGVSVFQLLHKSMEKSLSALELKKRVDRYAKELSISPKLITRSLNLDFSGGEKKKMEVLQEAVINPKLAIFDEVDTGVDLDSLKTIGEFLQRHKKNKTYIVITHLSRILKYLRPDEVLLMKEGRVVKTGDVKLIDKVKDTGFNKF